MLKPKVVFLCGSLEQGCDGVGDYVRNIVGSLRTFGIEARAVSLMDKYCTNYNFSSTDLNQNQLFYRIPYNLSVSERVDVTKTLLQHLNPEWVSLQFVIYSFHPKGLPFFLPKLFKQIRLNYRWHIMFHETYIGFDRKADFKSKAIGSLQKTIINQTVKKIEPEILTVSHFLHKVLIERLGYKLNLIPLISNISYHTYSSDILKSELQKISKNFAFEEKKSVGIFGTIYPDANLVTAFESIFKDFPNERCFELVTFGNGGNYLDDKINALLSAYGERIEIIKLGKQSEEVIAMLLNYIDCAICSTTLQHISKSGVYAAYRLFDKKVYFANTYLIPEFHDLSILEIDKLKNYDREYFDSRYLAQYYKNFLLKS